MQGTKQYPFATASAAQIADFQAILHNNFRPIQSLKGRTISKFNE